MKKSLRILLVASGIAALSGGTFLPLAAKEEKTAPIGSVRPAGKVASADLPTLAKISFRQATDAALAKVSGSVIKAELELEDGNVMYSFEIVGADRKITEVEIDAGNGKILNVDKDENGANADKGVKK